ncbi:MAG: hypothetical protein PHY31_07820 [Smithellaceae bacterium]|nr:hypothetical protein [Smithellaceae bacterium]
MKRWVGLFLAVVFVIGCASFRQNDSVPAPVAERSNAGAAKVNVLFVFTHTKQMIGYDTIPKIITAQEVVPAFNDIFSNAVKTFSNVANYAIFNESAFDVNMPARRKEKADLKAANDFAVDINVKTTESFPRTFIGGFVTLGSITLIPFPYVTNYEAVATIYDAKGNALKSYTQKDQIKTWVQAFLVFYYPFHPQERVREEVYLGMLRNIFLQMEAEGILNKQ